jgi:hypothetical protein
MTSRMKPLRRTWLRRIGAALGAASLFCLVWLAAVSTRKAGRTVDYSGLANERLEGVAEADRAWPTYDRAATALKAASNAEFAGTGPSDAKWPAYLEWVRSQRPTLDAARAAMRLPSLGLAMTSTSKPLLLEAMGAVAPVRAITRAMAADATLAADEGDWPRAVDTAQALVDLATQVHGAKGSLVEQLLALALFEQAGVLLTDLATRRDIPGEALTALADVAASAPETFRLHVAGERPYVLDSLQHMFGEPGFGGGHLTREAVSMARQTADTTSRASRAGGGAPAESLLGWPTIAVQVLGPTHDEAIAHAEALLEAIEREPPTPRWQRRESPRPSLPEMKYESMLAPLTALSGTRNSGSPTDLLSLRYAAARTLIALRRAVLAGVAPTSIAELAPRFIASEPLDPFDGKPLRWTVTDDAIHVYSIGPDLDDDGGRPCADTRWQDLVVPESEKAPVDGDAVVIRMQR